MLFADLTGYTAISAQLDPEEVYRFLRPGIQALRTIAEELGGTVPQILGDGFMAVFGVPVAHEDDAERAIRAAMAVRDHVGELNAGRIGILFPEVHAGVSSGEVMVAPADEAGGFAVIGDTVNTASRLADLASRGTVLVDDRTREQTTHAVHYGRRRLRDAKGKPGLRTYEAIKAVTKFPAPRMRRLAAASFVDRKRVMARLLAEVASADRSGSSRVLVVSGEAGVGKSRLGLELRRRLPRGSVLVGRCRAFGDRLPLSALAEAIAGAGEIDLEAAGSEAEVAIDRLARRIAGGAEEARLLASDLGLLLGTRRVPAGQARDSIREAKRAVRDVVDGLARTRPLVVSIDDFHWADSELRRLVEEIHRSPVRRPVLFLAFSRPVAGQRRLPTLDLDAMGEEVMRELAQALLGGRVPEELLRTSLARAGGNPLFLEETVGMLIDIGAVVSEDGRWRVADSDRLDTLPSALRRLIAARIDGLPAREKRVLQHAAVGESTWDTLIESISDVEDPREALRGLVGRGLVERRARSALAGSVEYEIKHELIRDVAYESIPRAERALLHLRIATWIHTQYRLTRDEPVAILAHHYERAWRLSHSPTGVPSPSRVPGLATRYLGRWAERVFAYQARQAEQLYSRAIRIADDAGGLIDARETARLLIGRAESLIEMGRHREAIADATRARRVAAQVDDSLLTARAVLALGRAESDLGRMVRARRLGEEALRRFEAGRDLRGQAWAHHRLSETWARSSLDRELDHLRRAHRLFARARDQWGRAIVAQDVAYLLTTRGDADFERWYEEARRLADHEGDLRSRAAVVRTWGYVCFYRGEFGAAMRAMHEARPVSIEAGDRYTEADTLIIEAMAAAATSAPDVAESLSMEVLRLARDLESGRIRALGLLAAARAATRAGHPSLAMRRLAAASLIVRTQNIAVDRVEVERIRAHVLLDRGSWSGVSRAARKIETGARAGGWTLWKPLPPLLRGQALLAAGAVAEAESELERVVDLARGVGAGGTLRFAEALHTQAILLTGARPGRGRVSSGADPETRAVASENRGLRALAKRSPEQAAGEFVVAETEWSALGKTSWLARALALRAEAVQRAHGRRAAAPIRRRAVAVLEAVGTPTRNRMALLDPLGGSSIG